MTSRRYLNKFHIPFIFTKKKKRFFAVNLTSFDRTHILTEDNCENSNGFKYNS